VCAYNAADTLEDCLTSLETLAYPDYEIIVVNDGSKDRTSQIAHGHPRARVLDTPNRGLSAARNAGLAEATGEIVAYTDADVRVDRDWLTFLVQPFLTSDVVGSGGPNVVPTDDPPMAQCIAREPGQPTHVLLNDRFAERCRTAQTDAYVQSYDQAFELMRQREIFDVCWRIGAGLEDWLCRAAALVWHHHRSSVKALAAADRLRRGRDVADGPSSEKFLDGHMLWRGRIYSPLPFIRSLDGTKINAGVWERPRSPPCTGPTCIRSRSFRTRSAGKSCRSS
jgi:glycosyltransferase involved in cell wall biosynthesis